MIFTKVSSAARIIALLVLLGSVSPWLLLPVTCLPYRRCAWGRRPRTTPRRWRWRPWTGRGPATWSARLLMGLDEPAAALDAHAEHELFERYSAKGYE